MKRDVQTVIIKDRVKCRLFSYAIKRESEKNESGSATVKISEKSHRFTIQEKKPCISYLTVQIFAFKIKEN